MPRYIVEVEVTQVQVYEGTWDDENDASENFDDGDEVNFGTNPNDPLSFPVAIPTLGPWAVAGLTALLGGLGSRGARRRSSNIG